MFLSFSTAVSRSPPSPVLEAQGWRTAIWHMNIHNKSPDEKPTWLCPAREARHEFVCLTSAHQNWEVMYGTELNKVSGLRTRGRLGQDNSLVGIPLPIISLTLCMIYTH